MSARSDARWTYQPVPLTSTEPHHQPLSHSDDPGSTLSPESDGQDAAESAPGEIIQRDVVQFTSSVYIVDAGSEKEIQCDVMRLGKMEGKVSFSYKTAEVSARAGLMFEHVSGRIEMEPGQDSAHIVVPIKDDPRWNPTTEFTVTLHEPTSCVLGEYLKTVRVKIIDPTPFPSERFTKDMQEKGKDFCHEVNKFKIFASFMFLLAGFDDIWWKTLATILIDQVKNLYVYMRLTIAIYLVDVVFNMDSEKGLLIPGDRVNTAYCLAAGIALPPFVIYAGNLAKIKMDIPGYLQRDFSRCIFRKFMNYTQEARDEVPATDMVVAITADAKDVTEGYVKLLDMIRLLGKLGVSIYFTLSQNPDVWWAAVIVPLIMMVWAYYRTSHYTKALDATGESESSLGLLVNDMLNNISLVADYQQRPQVNGLFAESAESLRTIRVPESIITTTNMFVPQLLGPLLVGLYTAVGANLVMQNSVKLGVFLATVSVFGDICDAFAELFGLMMDIIATFSPLIGVTEMMNMPIDPPLIKAVNRARRKTSMGRLHGLLEDRKRKKGTLEEPIFPGPFVPCADELEITFEDMCFRYDTSPGAKNMIGFNKENIKLPQGVVCSVIGPPARGSRSMLELIANKRFPTEGSIFIPSHLRILYVSADLMMFNFSVWQNLTFGNSKGNNPYRVEEILQALGMTSILAMIQDDLEQKKEAYDDGASDTEKEAKSDMKLAENPLFKLSQTQKAEITLARAFIMNPEVMVLHRPFMYYTEPLAAQKVARAIEEQRDNRGYKMPNESRYDRRPRTAFYTPDTEEEGVIANLQITIPESREDPLTIEAVGGFDLNNFVPGLPPMPIGLDDIPGMDMIPGLKGGLGFAGGLAGGVLGGVTSMAAKSANMAVKAGGNAAGSATKRGGCYLPRIFF